jgi:hypothetical protein
MEHLPSGYLPETFSICCRFMEHLPSGYLPETFSTCCRFMEHLPSENGPKHRFIPDTYRRRFPHVVFYGTSSIRIPTGDVSQTSFMFNMSPTIRHPNYEYILITIFMITQLNSVYFGFIPEQECYKSVVTSHMIQKNFSYPIQCMSLSPPKRISIPVLYPRNWYHT